MAETKKKTYKKQKLWKIFALKGPRFLQKMLAVGVSISMIFMGVPFGKQSVYIAAATDDATKIPNTMFLTKEALLELCKNTNGATGMLATGTNADVKLRINFGTRKADAKYYKDNNWDEDIAEAGPITWLVAGAEEFTPEGGAQTNGLVLYSEEPLIGCDAESGAQGRSAFQPNYVYDTASQKYWVGSDTTIDGFKDTWGTYDPDPKPDHVLANHWGASNLRSRLETLTGDDESTRYFTSAEKGLMSEPTISTIDYQPGENSPFTYTTTDVLYAPDATFESDRVLVGKGNTLEINMAHWGGYYWLRSPNPNSSRYALVALPGIDVISNYVFHGYPSISAAFRLNLSSVLFTSAASAASSSAEGGEKFSKIKANEPMTLRVHKYLPGTAKLTTEDTITVTGAAANDVLMVQGVTADGEDWSYSKKLNGPGAVEVGVSDVVAACGKEASDDKISGYELKNFSDCNIWLERAAGEEGSTITYASTPIVASTAETTTGAGCTLDPVGQKDPNCTEPGYKKHFKCTGCGQLFRVDKGQNPITNPVAINALGHAWDGGTVTTQPTTSAEGVTTYTCTVCGQTKAEPIPKLDDGTVPGGDDDYRPGGTPDPAIWGTPDPRGGIQHWVAADGTTSVQVPASNGIIWLKEDSDGTSAWYGLDNSAGVFAEGSRFWVRWLSREADPTLWQHYYDKFDTAHKTDVESNNLWIFLIGVTAPDGTEYTDLGTEVPLYIQKDADWDDNDIRSVFISGASDEVLQSLFHGKMNYPESDSYPDAEFYKVLISHFSPYAIYDELTDAENPALTPTFGVNTGDLATELLIYGLAILMVSSLGVMLRLVTGKRKFEK